MNPANPETQESEVLFCVFTPEQEPLVTSLIDKTRGNVQDFTFAYAAHFGEEPVLVPWEDLLGVKDAADNKGYSWKAIHPDHLDAQGEQDGPMV